MKAEYDDLGRPHFPAIENDPRYREWVQALNTLLLPDLIIAIETTVALRHARSVQWLWLEAAFRTRVGFVDRLEREISRLLELPTKDARRKEGEVWRRFLRGVRGWLLLGEMHAGKPRALFNDAADIPPPITTITRTDSGDGSLWTRKQPPCAEPPNKSDAPFVNVLTASDQCGSQASTRASAAVATRRSRGETARGNQTKRRATPRSPR